MERVYSNQVKGDYVLKFDSIEKEIIRNAFQNEIKNLDLKINKIINNPKNEGQATFACEIDRLRMYQEDFKIIISELSK